VATLPGLDGRKMSKSYDNTIPLFSSREQLKKLIGGILTDSRAPGEPKETEGSALFQIYQAFATEEETTALRKAYTDGIAWGDAKQVLFERVDQVVAPMREQYEALIADPARIEATLLAGAERARQVATPFLRELRSAVGLRDLRNRTVSAKGRSVFRAGTHSIKLTPAFKQYREKDGKFYFKLVAADGRLLLQSQAFDAPKDAGAAIGQLRHDPAALSALAHQLQPAAGVALADVAQALELLRQ